MVEAQERSSALVGEVDQSMSYEIKTLPVDGWKCFFISPFPGIVLRGKI